MATIKAITKYLESIAPLPLQEGYDNAGLIVGDPATEVKGIVICLDSTEEVIDEAINLGCNLIVAHHPIVFRGLKKFNGKNYVERVVMKAIRHDVAIYASHTNLDNVFQNGVNGKIAEKIGLQNTRILAPKSGLLKKLVTFVPLAHAEDVRSAVFEAGAGQIGAYDQCSFNTVGEGTFRGNHESQPFKGEKGKLHTEAEIKIETVFPAYLQRGIISALLNAHPYEEVAYDVFSIENKHPEIGSGLIGELTESMDVEAFLNHLKTSMQVGCVRYTNPHVEQVQKVAVCGGSGGFLLNAAKGAGAEVFITADYKYHEFFDAEDQIIIADIGHYESEQFTIDLFYDLITQKFSTFAVHCTKIRTNPVHYL